MAEKSLFFNALPNQTTPTTYNPSGYDKLFNADDISDWLSIAFDTGVLKDTLEVSIGSGLSVNVAVGKAAIKGKAYINDSIATLNGITAPTGANPYYYPIKLQYNNVQTASGRFIKLVVGEALTSIPTISNLTQDSSIWELMLAYVVVQPNATSISQIEDTRGQAVCPYFTAVKGYDDYYDAIVQQFESNVTMASTSTIVVTNLPTNLYNNKYSLIEVYVNGLREEESNYTINTSSSYITITFSTQKNAGTNVYVVLNNFIDGEGLSNVLNDYDKWVQDVATLKAANSYTYVCNGATDNVNISNLVNTFINGGTDYGSLNLKIVGTFGFTSYVAGTGKDTNPYRLFNFASGNRTVTLDFSNCSQVTINAYGIYVWVFVASSIRIKGLNLVINEDTSKITAETSIRAFNGNATCEDCRFWINGYLDTWIASQGTFTNCRGSVSNATGNSYCFLNSGILRLNGGYYLAYTGSGSGRSAVLGQSAANSVSILYGINAPSISRSGYYQTNSIYQAAAGNYVRCTDLISPLATYLQGDNNIVGTIPINKS